MSSEEVILWVAVATLIVAVISVIVTILYGEIERRLVRRQLRLAQEQAALRPDLSLSAAYSRIGKTVRHADGVLEFSIANTGQSTANNVRCSLQLKEPHLVLFLDGGPRTTSYLMRAAKITPVEPYRRSLNVRVRVQGRGKVRYRCWCDEAPPTEGDIEFEISEVPTPW